MKGKGSSGFAYQLVIFKLPACLLEHCCRDEVKTFVHLSHVTLNIGYELVGHCFFGGRILPGCEAVGAIEGIGQGDYMGRIGWVGAIDLDRFDLKRDNRP